MLSEISQTEKALTPQILFALNNSNSFMNLSKFGFQVQDLASFFT